MKNLDFVNPRIVERFQKMTKDGDYKVGDYIEFDRYIFFFVRKHYLSKFKLEEFRKVAGNIPYQYTYKTTDETPKLKPYLDILLEIYDRIEVYKTSKWDEKNKFD